MKDWGQWVIKVRTKSDPPNSYLTSHQETGAIGGFRLDAIKHMDGQFLREFVRGFSRSGKQTDVLH